MSVLRDCRAYRMAILMITILIGTVVPRMVCKNELNNVFIGNGFCWVAKEPNEIAKSGYMFRSSLENIIISCPSPDIEELGVVLDFYKLIICSSDCITLDGGPWPDHSYQTASITLNKFKIGWHSGAFQISLRPNTQISGGSFPAVFPYWMKRPPNLGGCRVKVGVLFHFLRVYESSLYMRQSTFSTFDAPTGGLPKTPRRQPQAASYGDKKEGADSDKRLAILVNEMARPDQQITPGSDDEYLWNGAVFWIGAIAIAVFMVWAIKRH